MGNQKKSNSGRGGFRAGAGRKKKEILNPQNRSFEEAVHTYNRERVYLTSIEAKKELPAYDRIQLANNARWLVNNSAIANRIVNGIARYAIGNGLIPRAKTSNPDWNKAAEDLFEARVGNDAFAFDKAGQVNFYEAQRLSVTQMITDGEFFAQLVKSNTPNQSPMVKFIGSEYVMSQYGIDPSLNIIDGVRVNDDGKPLSYRVVANPYNVNSNFVDIPSDDIIHIKKVHRHGFLRGVSWLSATSSLIQDLREILENEQLAAKMNTKIALTIESPDARNIAFGASTKKIKSPNSPVTNTINGGNSNQPNESITFDRLVSGSLNLQLKAGERVKAHEFDRPNINFAPWTELIIRQIAWGVGCSPELLWNFSGVGGAVTRHILQDAEIFFNEIRQIIEWKLCRRFWSYFIYQSMQNGELEDNPEWKSVDFIYPQKLTVDTGRDGALRLNLVRSGLLSEDRYFSELGQDAEQETVDIIRGYARKKRLVAEISKEEGIDLSMIEVFPPPAGAIANPAIHQEPVKLEGQ